MFWIAIMGETLCPTKLLGGQNVVNSEAHMSARKATIHIDWVKQNPTMDKDERNHVHIQEIKIPEDLAFAEYKDVIIH